MPNEFIIKNGFRSQGNSEISGSINISGSGTFSSTIYGLQSTSNLAFANASSPSLGLKFYASNLIIFTTPGGDTVKIGTGYFSTNAPLTFGSQAAAPYINYSGNNLLINAGTLSTTGYTSIQTGNFLIGTTTDSGPKLLVKGSGTTSATTAFQVQNANASASLSVLDNGSSTILSSAETGLTIQHTNGNYTSIINGNGSAIAAGQMGMYFNGTKIWTWNGAIFQIPGSVLGTGVNATTLQILGGWGGATVGTSLRLGSNTGNQGVFTATTGTQSTVEIGNAGNETWSPSSGNATYNLLNILPRINTSGTYSGIVRGFYYSPTLTSLTGVTHRAIETTSGDIIFGGNTRISVTGSFSITSSAGTGSAIYAYKSGSTVLDIQGSQGQLFSVVDALSGSLMSVNDVSGLPILEVFSDDRVVMGTYGAPALIVTGSNTIISGSLRGRVVTLSTASATASMDCSLSNFFDLTLSGSMYLGVSNIQPGETINLRITQPATSGSLNYTSSIKFPNGLPYSASATSSVVDLISFISFDSSTLYATSLKNLI